MTGRLTVPSTKTGNSPLYSGTSKTSTLTRSPDPRVYGVSGGKLLNPVGRLPGGAGGASGDVGGVENEGICESLAAGAVGSGTLLGSGIWGICESLGAGKVGSWAWLGAGTAVTNKVTRVKPAIALCVVPPALGCFRRLLIPPPVIPIRQNISRGLFGLTFKQSRLHKLLTLSTSSHSNFGESSGTYSHDLKLTNLVYL
jgi:hypothetical protein